MGSASDLPVMQAAIDTLESFGIEVDKRVISAHRAAHALMEWAESAEERGLSVIIAGAGGAAHLAGVIAGLTHLPVIGVPVRSKTLDGLDSLLSMVQMPSGIPVATVAIDGAKNAALLAVSILALQDPSLREQYIGFRRQQTEKVLATVISYESSSFCREKGRVSRRGRESASRIERKSATASSAASLPVRV